MKTKAIRKTMGIANMTRMLLVATFYILYSLFFSPAGAQAKVFDRLVLKNGRVVTGYLAGQQPGQCIKFYTESISNSNAKKTTIDADELIPMTTPVSSKYDDINSLSNADGLPRTCVFSIGDVTKIERNLRPEGQTFGLVDVVTTRSDERYEGQITGQVLGSCIQLWDGHQTQTIYNNDLARQEKRALDPQIDILQQTPFLDVVITQRNTYRGLIILQDYGNEQQSSFLRIRLEDGTTSRVAISDIMELQREPNKLFSTAEASTTSDFVPEPGIIYFNQQPIASISTGRDYDENITIDNDDLDGSPILPLENGRLVIVMDDNDDNRNTILLPVSKRKSGHKKKFAFSYEDIVNKSVMPDTNVSENGVLRKEFTIQAGTYVLYHRQTGQVNFCEFQ